MTILDKLETAKTLWIKAMPPECPLPGDYEFLLWIENFDALLETGIVRAAKKMRLNLREHRELVPQAAQRYSTSVMTNLKNVTAPKEVAS